MGGALVLWLLAELFLDEPCRNPLRFDVNTKRCIETRSVEDILDDIGNPGKL